MNKIKEFWGKKKDIIKNTIIVVTVPLLGVCLYNLNRQDKVVDEIEDNITYLDVDEIKEVTEEVKEEA